MSPPTAPATPGAAPRWLSWPTGLGLAALFWVLAVTSVGEKSAAYDELGHLTAGVSYWRTGDHRLHPENGVLAQRLLGLPAALSDVAFPEPAGRAWAESDVWTLGDRFLYRMGHDPAALLFGARAVTAALGALLCLLVWAWSRSLFGPVGGLISGLLAALSPTLLAHGRLATSDVCAGLAFLAALAALDAVLRHVSPGRVLLSSLATSALVLAKFSGLLVLPMAAALAAWRLRQGTPLPLTGLGRARRLTGRGQQALALAALAAVQVSVVLLVTWAAYGFRYEAFGEHRVGGDRFYFDGWSHVEPPSSPAVAAALWARDQHLLPEAFLYGLSFVLVHAQHRSAFLDGVYDETGFVSFFPRAFAYKTPLPLFLLLALALVAWRRAGRGPPARAGPFCCAPLWVLLGVSWAVALGSHLNIGHRHLLPTYPVLFILAGGAARGLGRRAPARTALLALGLAWFALASWAVRPHYLSFFNLAAGGPGQGWRHLVDSSLDWGQDLPGLKRWLDEQAPHGAPVYLSYFGKGDPQVYGIRARHLPFSPPTYRKAEMFPLAGGVYCISATMLQQVYLDVKLPWTGEDERRYRQHLAQVQVYERASADDGLDALFAERGKDYWSQVVEGYDTLRFARLCAWLRRREPDDHVGHSILIYQLTDDDVRQALLGKPPG